MSNTAPQSPALALAVDLGGTKVEAALVTDQGVVLPARRFRSPTGPQRTSDELQAAVDEAVTDALGALPADATLVGRRHRLRRTRRRGARPRLTAQHAGLARLPAARPRRGARPRRHAR